MEYTKEAAIDFLNGVKVAVSTPEESERIQKILVELGYTWNGSIEPAVMHTDMRYIFISKFGKKLTYSNCRTYFDLIDNNTEIDKKYVLDIKLID